MIRKAEVKDLEIINELIHNLDSNEKVSEEMLNHPFYRYIVYIIDNKIVAFLKYSVIYERMEIDYVYVLEECRGKKIATQLIEYAILENPECKDISLEVRESNIAAQKLYESLGFKRISVRERYYGNENALIYMRSE